MDGGPGSVTPHLQDGGGGGAVMAADAGKYSSRATDMIRETVTCRLST